MNEFLLTLLQALLAVAVPVVSTFLVQYLKTVTKNEAAHKYIDDVADAVSTAVIVTSQTYADTLKKSGDWTRENQVEALNKSISQARTMLADDAIRYLESNYGNVTKYLEAKVEAEVKLQK